MHASHSGVNNKNAIDAFGELCLVSGMTLDAYLVEHGIKEAQFAALIGTNQSTVNRLRKGQVPGKQLMALIFEATGGAVRADDFFGLSGEAA